MLASRWQKDLKNNRSITRQRAFFHLRRLLQELLAAGNRLFEFAWPLRSQATRESGRISDSDAIFKTYND